MSKLGPLVSLLAPESAPAPESPPLVPDGLAVASNELCRRFGRIEAIKDVSLTVPFGITFGLLGPNGSGKTTLLRLLAGVLEPTSGDIRILGGRPQGDLLNEVGYMPQGLGLYDGETVWENIRCFAGVQGVRSKAQMEEALDLVQIRDRMHSVVRDLSTGMARRVSLACALAHRPRLLLLDEPTVGVDPYLRRQFWGYFHRLNAEGVTILLTTHALDEAERCHRVGILRSGRLVAQGTPRDVSTTLGASTLEGVFLKLAEESLGIA
jgi:ABC-2 type transport system ATP-binding protein